MPLLLELESLGGQLVAKPEMSLGPAVCSLRPLALLPRGWRFPGSYSLPRGAGGGPGGSLLSCWNSLWLDSQVVYVSDANMKGNMHPD